MTTLTRTASGRPDRHCRGRWNPWKSNLQAFGNRPDRERTPNGISWSHSTEGIGDRASRKSRLVPRISVSSGEDVDEGYLPSLVGGPGIPQFVGLSRQDTFDVPFLDQ